MFDIICADVVCRPGEKLALLAHLFAPIKDFRDVYKVEHPGQTRRIVIDVQAILKKVTSAHRIIVVLNVPE